VSGKQRGLPKNKKLRHDSHFVDEITADSSEAIGRLIEIGLIRPNPEQPRKSFGDLSEMVESVKEKGILEPILVRFSEAEEKYEIIAGERRYQAASLAGLRKVPCIEVDVDNRGMLEISLVENLQRKDLNAFEEAAAILRLSEQFRYTHEEIARKLGKSRPIVTETLSLNRIPEDVQDRCRQADIMSKSMLLQIVRQDSPEAMHHLVDKITGEGMTREEARRFNKADGDSKPRLRRFKYNYKPEDRPYHLQVTFDKKDVEKEEVILALKEVLENLVRELEIERFEAGAEQESDLKRKSPRSRSEAGGRAEVT
jgi:ParB family chromosome partitioning protein